MATSDLKLDTTTHFLKIDADTNFDLGIVTGIDYYAQKIKTKLLLFLDEWFLDTQQGIDWWGDILVKSPNLNNVDNQIKLNITEEIFIVRLLEWNSSFDVPNKTYYANFTAETIAGILEFSEPIQVV